MEKSSSGVCTARLLFRPWPRPIVQCPQCETTDMRAVEVRVVHGARETVVDAHGARTQAADPPVANLGCPRFVLEVTFQCRSHQSILRIVAEGGASLLALVDVDAADGSAAALGEVTPHRRSVAGPR